MSGVGIEVVKTIVRLEALAPEWAALWQRVPATTPFQSPAWLVPWWRHFRPGRLSTVGLWRAGRLTGVLPLYHADESPGGNLRLLGGGNTDYLDALVEPGCARELGPVIGEALAQIREPDEAVRLERLPAWSPLACVEGDFDRGREDEPCPVLDLPHGSRSCWKDARYLLRRLGRMDGFAIRTAGGDDLGVAIDCLAALHASRWAERGMPGIFADPTNAAFLREAAAALLDAGASVRQIRDALDALRRKDPTLRQPLVERRLVLDGSRLLVESDRVRFDPHTGQTVLDLDAGHLETAARATLVTGLVRPLQPPVEQAETWFERASEWDSDPAQWEDAVAAYRRVVAIDPTYAAAWNNLGLLLHRMGRYDEARGAYTAALEQDKG